jgi:arylsulfatase A-like enzyme
VFFSDHGEYNGDYDLIEKWPSGMHDCLARDPLIMAGPGIASGRSVDDMVEMIDLVPTVHDLAGIEADYTHFGQSLMPVMSDPSAGHREHAFTEGGFLVDEEAMLERPTFPYDLKGDVQHDDPVNVGKVVCVRSQRWTYVWRLYEPAELYDRVGDPAELHNLAGSTEHAAVEAELSQALLRWFVATGDVMPWEADPRFPGIDLPVPRGAG